MNRKTTTIIILLVSLLFVISCNFLEMAFPQEFEAFIDTGDPEYDNPGINSESSDESDNSDAEMIEEVEEGEEVILFEDSPETNELNLTPEEKLNQGTHHYQIKGEGTPLLGGTGIIDEENDFTHEFSEEGVMWTIASNDPLFFIKESPNHYIYLNENVEMTVVYTMTGFEYRSDGNGIFSEYIATFDE